MFNATAFLTYIVITSITPGPNNIMSMSNASRFGFRRSMPFNFGVWLGFTIVMLACTVFSATLQTVVPVIKPAMLVVGAGYILWLAWKILNSSTEVSETTSSATFKSGLMLQFVNVKIYIYGITAMSVFILPHFSNGWVVLLFMLLLCVVGCTSNTLWTIGGSVFRKLFVRYGRIINMVMAAALVYCAISLFL